MTTTAAAPEDVEALAVSPEDVEALALRVGGAYLAGVTLDDPDVPNGIPRTVRAIINGEAYDTGFKRFGRHLPHAAIIELYLEIGRHLGDERDAADRNAAADRFAAKLNTAGGLKWPNADELAGRPTVAERRKAAAEAAKAANPPQASGFYPQHFSYPAGDIKR